MCSGNGLSGLNIFSGSLEYEIVNFRWPSIIISLLKVRAFEGNFACAYVMVVVSG